MISILASIEPSIDRVSKLLGAALKACVGLGCITTVFYSLKISYFPQGVSLGDGLLFIVVAGCFGFLYLLFVICMTSLGISMAWLLKPAMQISVQLACKIMRVEVKQAYQPAPFAWWSVPYTLVAIIFAIVLAKSDLIAYIKLGLMTIALYMFYSIALAAGNRYKTIKQTAQDNAGLSNQAKSEELTRHRNMYFFCIGIIILLPLFISSSTGQLLDGAMRLAQLRVEASVLYIKAPYSKILPESLIIKKMSPSEDITAFSGVTVLLHGVGDTTVVSFKDNGDLHQLNIPNTHIIIERKHRSTHED